MSKSNEEEFYDTVKGVNIQKKNKKSFHNNGRYITKNVNTNTEKGDGYKQNEKEDAKTSK